MALHEDFDHPDNVRFLTTGATEDDDQHTSWTPVDLDDALNGIDIAPPSVLARSDGIHLLYPARIHWFQGESESLKSWLCQVAVVQVIQAGHNVLYVDYEDEARGVVARLLALGLTPGQVRAHLTYIRPDEPLLGNHHGKETYGPAHTEFTTALRATEYTLSIIDGVTEAMTVEGLNLLDNADIATWMRRIPKRIADTGAAVGCVDHVTKSAEGRGRYAIGGQHKLAGVTGAAYEVSGIKPLSRATTDPVEGAARITVHKDRPGWVRSKALGGVIGTLEITAWPDGTVTAALVHGQGSVSPPMQLVAKVMEHLRSYDGTTKRDLRESVEAKATAIDACLTWLTDIGRAWVRIERVGNSHRHFLTDTGKAEMGWL